MDEEIKEGAEQEVETQVEPVVETPETPVEPEEKEGMINPETPAQTAPQDDSIAKLSNLIKPIMPEADLSTPEAVLTATVPLVEEIVAFNKDMVEVIDEVPEFGDMLIYIRKGYTPQEAYHMSFDMEEMTPPAGAPDYEGVMKAKEARRAAVEGKKKRMAEINMNIDGSVQNIAALASSKGWDEAKAMEFSDKVAGLFNDWADGKLSPESLAVLEKGFGYDNDVAASYEDGMVAGKNAQIEKKRVTKETSDGLPKMSNTGTTPGKKPDTFTTGLEVIANRKPVI